MSFLIRLFSHSHISINSNKEKSLKIPRHLDPLKGRIYFSTLIDPEDPSRGFDKLSDFSIREIYDKLIVLKKVYEKNGDEVINKNCSVLEKTILRKLQKIAHHLQQPTEKWAKKIIDNPKSPFSLKCNALVNPEKTHHKDHNLLHRAVLDNDYDEVADLIAVGANINGIIERSGATALHLVENPDIAQLLIDSGADIQARDHKGNSPLHSSAYPEVTRVLLRAGAHPDAKNHEGNSPLHVARSREIAEILLKYGASIFSRNFVMQTPLHTLKTAGAISTLLWRGAMANAIDLDGHLPIDTASRKEIRKVLRRYTPKV